MFPLTPDLTLYLVLACITTVAGVAAVSLDQFQKPSGSGFAMLGAVSPWLVVAGLYGVLTDGPVGLPFLWTGLIGSWGFFMAATLAFLLKRPGPPKRGAAAASVAGMFASGATAYLIFLRSGKMP